MLKLIQASFKKTPYFNPRKIIQKIYCLKRVLFSHLSYHQMLHFSWKFSWNSSSLSEDKNFYYFNCNCFSFFWIFLLATKKSMSASIRKCQQFFVLSEWVDGLVIPIAPLRWVVSWGYKTKWLKGTIFVLHFL